MGDRRNIIVEFDNENSVALYTHWSGSDMSATLARALHRGRGRWEDDEYLTRIIFSQMLADFNKNDVIETLMSETGFGIAPFKTGTTNYCEASPGYDLRVSLEGGFIEGDDEGGSTRLSFEEFITAFLPKPVPA